MPQIGLENVPKRIIRPGENYPTRRKDYPTISNNIYYLTFSRLETRVEIAFSTSIKLDADGKTGGKAFSLYKSTSRKGEK